MRTFFSSGFVTVSASLLRAFRICEAATLVEVFSNAWSCVRSELIVAEDSNSTKFSRSHPVRWRRNVAECMAAGNTPTGEIGTGHSAGGTVRAELKTGSLSNTLKQATGSVVEGCKTAAPGAQDVVVVVFG